MKINSLPVSEALSFIKERITLDFIASRMGVKSVVLSAARNHTIKNGKPYYLPVERTEQLRAIVRDIANELTSTCFDKSQDVADRLNVLKVNGLNIRYLTCNLLNKQYNWMNVRLSERSYTVKGRDYCYYNSFSDEDVRNINNALRTIALELLSLEILDEYPPKIEESLRLSNMDIQTPNRIKSDDDLERLFHSSILTTEEQQQLIEDELDCGLI